MKGEKIRYLPLILSCLMILSIVNVASGQVGPLIAMDPVANAADPPGSFTINVTIADAIDLFSYETKLGFNPSILSLASITEGPFIKDQTTAPLGTIWTTILGSNYVYAVCVTMGKYPGVDGSGTLFTVTFDVIDTGECALDLYDSILLDSNGAMITHESADGTFAANSKANLKKKSAWPEHHHLDISKDEDGNQTLYAKARNLGLIDLYVRATFDIMRDDSLLATVHSGAVLVAPDGEVDLTADFGPLLPADAGKYYVSARAYYSYSGTYWSPGEKVKTFSFAVVP